MTTLPDVTNGTGDLVFALPAQVRAAPLDQDALLAAAKRRAPDPTIFEESAPFFWRAEISNDNLDSYFSRMHDSTLKNFARDATRGVSFQNSHNWRELGLGQSLAGEFLEDGKRHRVEATFYTIPGLRLNTLDTDEFIRGVRAGIVRDVSVGFHGGEIRCGICDGELFNGWFGYMGAAFAFIAALPLASIRPQTFAVLAFGSLLAVLRLELRPRDTAVLAVPLFFVWQNLHPSVSVAAVALAALAAAQGARRLAGRGQPFWPMAALAALAGAMTFATPDGFEIVSLSARNATIGAAMGVTEWLPLWSEANRFLAVPVLLVAVVVAWVLLRHPRRVDAGELAVAIALFAMTLLAYRFVLFWALSLVPLVARAVPPPAAERRTPRWVAPGAMIGVATAGPLVLPTRFDLTIPVAAMNRLRDSGVTGTVFAHFPWGGPAIDLGYPRWRVAYDGRYYRYTRGEWDRYLGVASGAIGLAAIDRIYAPAAFVLGREWNGRLIASLRADRGWRELYADRGVAVFIRKEAAAR